jgi:nicotinamidase-related amidase
VKYFSGKPIPTTLEEVVDPDHTALLVVDVQNDFCREEGVFPKHGVTIQSIKDTVQNLSTVIEAARAAKVKIIYVQHTTLPNRLGDSPSWTRFMMKTFSVEDPRDIPEFTLDSSWGHRVVDEIKPKEVDVIVKKHRSSAFIGTDLDFILKNMDVKTLVTTGVTTEGCVESTARDGQFYDYMIVTLSDCVNSDSRINHEAALTIMGGRWDVVTSSKVIDIWLSKT